LTSAAATYLVVEWRVGVLRGALDDLVVRKTQLKGKKKIDVEGRIFYHFCGECGGVANPSGAMKGRGTRHLTSLL